jgi:hypothetical protein
MCGGWWLGYRRGALAFLALAFIGYFLEIPTKMLGFFIF